MMIMTILILQLVNCNDNTTINIIMITMTIIMIVKDKEVLTHLSSAFMLTEALVPHAQE